MTTNSEETCIVKIKDLDNLIKFTAEMRLSVMSESKIESLNNFPIELQSRLFSYDITLFESIRTKTPELCSIAVSVEGDA
ncbi:MAG: hypothetical protein AAB966_05025, partial [Patescibacteria group bacterium]